MGKAVVGTCDYDGCDNVGEVSPAHLMLDDQDWTGDLCQEHSAVLRRWLKKGQATKPKTRTMKVWTMEEIERLKNQQ